MLVQFSVENFKSFKQEVVFSMVPAAIKEKESDENVFFATKKQQLLKSAVVYGANASGKSNLFDAMNFMDWFIQNSSRETQANEKINVDRFRLSTETDNKPAKFEIVFFHENVRYRYGFAVDPERVHAEWLFYKPKVQEVPVFTRTGQEFALTSHFESEKPLKEGNRIRPNALFLSVSAQFNGALATKILQWFNQFNCISGLKEDDYLPATLDLLRSEGGRNMISTFLKRADTGINTISFRETPLSREDVPLPVQNNAPDGASIVRVDINTVHKKFNKKGDQVTEVPFVLSRDESQGTKRFFALCGPIIDTLKHGKVLVVDELDARLHPDLVSAICLLFNSNKLNPRNAQLVFASHNTHLLGSGLFRRDQIWFSEKNQFGASDLYSLIEFKDKDNKKVRNDASYEKDYLRGRYGAVPCINDLGAPYGD